MFSFAIRSGFLPVGSPSRNDAQVEPDGATLLCTREYNNIDLVSRHE